MFKFNCFFIVLNVILLSKRTHGVSYLEAFVNSLKNDLTFCVENEDILDVNLLFGVTIVSGQLNFLKIRNVDLKIRRKISDIKYLCDIISKKAVQRNIANINYDETQKKWFSTNLWSFDYEPSNLQNCTGSSWISNRATTPDLLDSSTFHSDYYHCTRSLIEKCDISENCLHMMFANSTEYILTHQILYLLVLKQLVLQNWCSFEYHRDAWLNELSSFLNEKCYRVYHYELPKEHNENRLLYDATLADLFIEQVVVCGLQSYTEFFQFKYADIILRQNITNIKADISSNRDSKHNERIHNLVHMISVRIAAMTLYVKQISKNSSLIEYLSRTILVNS